MKLGIRRSFKILAPGNSLRRRIAYSLALVRLILAPVILLAVYYLFRMSWIVDRIVNVDAPAATLAQQASIEMLEARRAERNFLLLRDANYLVANQETINKTQQILDQIRTLEPGEYAAVQKASEAIGMYRERFAAALPALEQPAQGPTDRVQAVVRAYERDLNDLLKRSRHSKRGQLVEELRKRVGSFDTQISETVQEGNPELQRVTEDLQTSSLRPWSTISPPPRHSCRHARPEGGSFRSVLPTRCLLDLRLAGTTLLLLCGPPGPPFRIRTSDREGPVL
jgi:CHASE3 domain sensor protein